QESFYDELITYVKSLEEPTNG
ncbi:YlxR family protein, partial [Listeria monocytogenes]|nr:YlxR family protein [Listeria monocytogenes]